MRKLNKWMIAGIAVIVLILAVVAYRFIASPNKKELVYTEKSKSYEMPSDTTSYIMNHYAYTPDTIMSEPSKIANREYTFNLATFQNNSSLNNTLFTETIAPGETSKVDLNNEEFFIRYSSDTILSQITLSETSANIGYQGIESRVIEKSYSYTCPQSFHDIVVKSCVVTYEPLTEIWTMDVTSQGKITGSIEIHVFVGYLEVIQLNH